MLTYVGDLSTPALAAQVQVSPLSDSTEIPEEPKWVYPDQFGGRRSAVACSVGWSCHSSSALWVALLPIRSELFPAVDVFIHGDGGNHPVGSGDDGLLDVGAE